MAYQRVLLPIDGSSYSHLAVSHAIRLADEHSEIIILTVMPEVPNTIGGSTHREIEREDKQKARSIIDPVCEQVSAEGLTCKPVVVMSNHPASAILHVAKENNVDVIVMGSRGRSTLEELVLGSVTHQVVSETALPVLVVG